MENPTNGAQPDNTNNATEPANKEMNGMAAVNNVSAQANVTEEKREDVKSLDTAMQDTQKAMSQGVDQVQQAGQAGIQKIGNVVGQIVQSKKDEVPQPPVSKDEKVYAAISYIPFVALISIIVKPDSAFVRLHAKQGLLLAIIFFFVGIFAAIVSLFGLIGQILAFLLGLVPLATLIVDAYSMYLSFTGYWWKIPVLGTVADVIPVEWMAKSSKANITGQVGVAKEDYDVRQDALKEEKVDAQPVPQQSTNIAPSASENGEKK